MIKAYIMSSCKDCMAIMDYIENDNRFEIIDIGADVRNLKEFLALRDNDSSFKNVRENGYIGVPCFLKEDRKITFEYYLDENKNIIIN